MGIVQPVGPAQPDPSPRERPRAEIATGDPHTMASLRSSSAAAARRLESLRTHRVRPPRASLLGAAKGPLEGVLRDLKREDSVTGRVERVLSASLPVTLQRATHVRRVTRATVALEVASDSLRYRLDRWLRSGGEAALRPVIGSRSVRISVERSSPR